METSILTDTKKALNLAAEYTIFDPDIIMCINSAFSTLNQLGVGALAGVSIEDEAAKWSELALPTPQLGMVRTYIYLKARLLFDPPTTSFLLSAIETQIREHEWRLNVFREEELLIEEVTT